MIARLRRLSLSRVRERVGERGYRIGLTLGGIAGGLLLLDLIGLVATIYFHEEILAQAEAAGLGSLLKP